MNEWYYVGIFDKKSVQFFHEKMFIQFSLPPRPLR